MGRCMFMRKGETHTAPSIVDANTLLLLHGESIVDDSQYANLLENNGVSVSSEQSKFGGKSLYFNGSSKMEDFTPPTKPY